MLKAVNNNEVRGWENEGGRGHGGGGVWGSFADTGSWRFDFTNAGIKFPKRHVCEDYIIESFQQNISFLDMKRVLINFTF